MVGSQATAQSNVLLNIYGDTTIGATPVNVVYIGSNASDLSLVGVANAGGSGTFTIKDTQTSTTLADQFVAMYVLGEQSSGGWSRFTTSQNAVTWVVSRSGQAVPSSCSTTGSLYSDTTSTGGALYVCKTGTWQAVPHL